MNDKVIDIKAEAFPWQIKLLGLIMLVFAFALFPNYWWASLILTLLALTIITGYSGTEIDHRNNMFREYDSYFFLKIGKPKKYNRIEKIFINRSRESHTVHSANIPTVSSIFTYIVYDAYLKFDNGEKIFLTGRKNKQKLILVLNPAVRCLKVELVDNTIR